MARSASPGGAPRASTIIKRTAADAASSKGKVTSTPLTNAQLITVWSKAVDTQMHFNEMSVKSRQLGLTFVAAALATAVVLLGQDKEFSLIIFGWKLHVTVLLVIAALVALLAVRTLDLGVYHQMLRGSVAFGRDLEQQRLAKLLGVTKGMTDAITHFSRTDGAQASGSPMEYTGAENTTARDKVGSFYRRTGWFLVIAAIVLFILTNWATVETQTERRETQATSAEATGMNTFTGNAAITNAETPEESAPPTMQTAPATNQLPDSNRT